MDPNKEAPQNVTDKHQNPIDILSGYSCKQLIEQLQQEKVPLASIMKELEEHPVVSFLYDTRKTDKFGVYVPEWEHTRFKELWFIHGEKPNMPRWTVFFFLTFSKKGDNGYVCLNQVEWSSQDWFAYIKKLKSNEFVEFLHKKQESLEPKQIKTL